MQYKPKLCLLQVLGVMLLGIPHIVPDAAAQVTGTCSRALGEAYLDVGNVRARILNTGGLFYRGEPHFYEVPKGSGANAIFAGSIWIAGQVNGQLRASATRYGEWEMWAGPLDDSGNPPVDCAVYDRVYNVYRSDVEAYESDGSATTDLTDWPTGLGAPTVDANGDLIDVMDQPLAARVDRVIDLVAGERPAIEGDQTIWWVMNDRGNEHTSTNSPPIGLEVHGMAYSFNDVADIGNSTFYKFIMYNRGAMPLTDAYFGNHVDVDLGNFDDDYVGSDTTLGLGYAYNSDNFDEGGEGYGSPVPAIGYDYLQGPIVSSPGDTALVSGVAVLDYANLHMTSFTHWYSGGGVQGGPGDAEGYYSKMQGLWLDGSEMTWGGTGRGHSNIPTKFSFSGDPIQRECWSEVNVDCLGTVVPSGDRRFASSTGPFVIEAGSKQEVVFAVVWAIGEDNWDSIRALREADAIVQLAFDEGFQRAETPDAPIVAASIFDAGVTLSWTNDVSSNNYLESYSQRDAFASEPDQYYEFEGYQIFRFTGEEDLEGELIATYDVVNGVQIVVDFVDYRAPPPLNELTEITASGADTGIEHTHLFTGLTNSTSYYYGVQAYAFSEFSSPKVLLGEMARAEVIPRRSEETYSQAAIEALFSNEVPDFVAEADAIGTGTVIADVVDPGAVIDHATYTTHFYEYAGGVSYDISRTSDAGDVKMFDGRATGKPAPLKENVVLIDGLQFTVLGTNRGMTGFKMIANGAGLLDPPDMAAFAFNSWGFPTVEGKDRPESGINQSTNDSRWGIHVGGGSGPYGDEAGPFNSGSTWVGRSIREGSAQDPWPNVGSDDFEWRFPASCEANADGTVTDGGCTSWRGFGDGALIGVPYAVWNTGTTSDPVDDFRMLPLICESECDGNGIDGIFDIAGDHPVSGGDNDPYSDWIYWYKPEDNGASPGEQGYQDFFFGNGGNGDRAFSRQVLVNYNGGSAQPYNADMLESGSIIQYKTNKPNQPGDTYTIHTAGYGVTPASDSLKTSRLTDINVVPNPYVLASAYERQPNQDEVRFTNLPREEQVTLRIFSLHGQLIQTLVKPSGVNQLSWDLQTSASLSIASGMYLIHVDVEGLGTHVIKFAAIIKSGTIVVN